MTFNLAPIPGELRWKNDPADWQVGPDSSLEITTGPQCDWFNNPTGNDAPKKSAPAALFTPPDANFMLSAKVTVDFASDFDAGVLFFYLRDDLWAKLCFEYSPQAEPMVVSVVTRGLSDDCNSVVIDGNSVHYRIARMGQALAMHYSLDGADWHFVRHFSLGNLDNLQVGFLAQCPTGQGCKVTFSDITYHASTLSNLRDGS